MEYQLGIPSLFWKIGCVSYYLLVFCQTKNRPPVLISINWGAAKAKLKKLGSVYNFGCYLVF